MLAQTADILTMDYAQDGTPFVVVNKPAESDSKGMDLAFNGTPYIFVYSITTSTVIANSNFFMFF